MIETRTYKCEYCGAEFDDEYEAHCHEYVCQYEDVKKRKGSCLGFYREDGTEIKFDAQVVYNELNNMAAFIVGNNSDIKFIEGLFGWIGYDDPFSDIKDEAYQNYYGLWYFDPDLNYYGEWVRVDDQIKKWTDIKNKFIKDG
nr:MAG TPA: Monocytic leukemia zinc finger protein finger, acetyl transferase, DNA [Caudoviricetes sp.]